MGRRAGSGILAGLTAVAALVTVTIPASARAPAPAPGVSASALCPSAVAEVTGEQVDAVFALASRKLGAAAEGDPTRYPLGALQGRPQLQLTGPTAWTSGFFPGELWLMVQRTGAADWLEQARRWTTGLLPMARYRGTHDLGFMVGIPTSLGYALEPGASTRNRYARAEARAARTLAKRWNPRVQAIKSADYQDRWGVIIDSAMNAPMLIEVGDRLGGSAGERLRQIGTMHMRTLARDFIRADGSTFHRMAYRPGSGRLIGPIPGQGLNPRTSTWARGQAWAIAGFAQAYALTGDPEFLDAAVRTADFWMEQVPAGCVPAWDLALTSPSAPRDTSSLAIVASGLLHLADAIDAREPPRAAPPTAEPNPSSPPTSVAEPSTDSTPSPSPSPTQSPTLVSDHLRSYARTALGTLATPIWTTAYSANPGILRRQTLSVPADAREGTYVWGDYYLLDALLAVAGSAGADGGDPADQVGREPAVVPGLQHWVPPV